MGDLKLYSHGGSENHGCEAIVRGTAKILNCRPTLFSLKKEQDQKYNLQEICNIKEDKNSSVPKYSIKNIKVDFKSSLIKPTTDRILGNDSLEVLEQKEKIEINKYFYLIGLEKPYEITLIVYYEDVLTNWYRQVLNVHYTATNKLKEGEHIGIVKYEVDKEELIQAEDVNST